MVMEFERNVATPPTEPKPQYVYLILFELQFYLSVLFSAYC